MLVVIFETDVLQTGKENQSVLYNIIESLKWETVPAICYCYTLMKFQYIMIYAVYNVLHRNICYLFMYPTFLKLKSSMLIIGKFYISD